MRRRRYLWSAARIRPGRSLTLVALLAALAIGQSGAIDGAGAAHTQSLFDRTLVAFATTRTLNGIISVIQGTELAVQPAGMGATLSVGQLLDPINDLVERFSWLLLAAGTATGIHLVLLEAAASTWLQAVLVALALALALTSWRPRARQGRTARALGMLTLIALFIRFCLPLAAVASHHFGEAFLEARRADALATLERTRTQLEAYEHEQRHQMPDSDEPERSLLGTFRAYLDEQARRLDPRTRIERLQHQLDAAVDGIITLIVVFALQAILAPLSLVLLLWLLTRRALAMLAPPGAVLPATRSLD